MKENQAESDEIVAYGRILHKLERKKLIVHAKSLISNLMMVRNDTSKKREDNPYLRPREWLCSFPCSF